MKCKRGYWGKPHATISTDLDAVNVSADATLRVLDMASCRLFSGYGCAARVCQLAALPKDDSLQQREMLSAAPEY